MSLENRMISGGLAATSALASAFQSSLHRPIDIDETGPAAIARLTAALDRQIAARLAAEAERDALILELNRARQMLARRSLRR